MPVTRRRRANPPDQPENNNHLVDQLENATETLAAERPVDVPQDLEGRELNQGQVVQKHPSQPSPVVTPRVESTHFHPFASAQPSSALQTSSVNPIPQLSPVASFPPLSQGTQATPTNQVPQTPVVNAERIERQDYPSGPTPASTPSLESGRRTARGELFRRPPQPPVPQPVPTGVAAASLQGPIHEVSLPLGNLLHLAYNPGYTGSEEARSTLLKQLERESKAGGRVRCWSCGSLGIVYDRWEIHSKAFSEVGIAYCEICGVWSVM